MIGKIYKKCEDLNLYRFEKCLFEHDFSKLIKWGFFTSKEKDTAWETLYIEYCQLSNNDSYNNLKRLLSSMGKLEIKITVIEISITILSQVYDKDSIDILKDYGYKFEYSKNYDNRIKQLNLITKKLKATRLELDRVIVEYKNEIEGDQSDDEKQSFDKLLSGLSKFKGYQIRKKETTVTEFIADIELYNEHIKSLENGSRKDR